MKNATSDTDTTATLLRSAGRFFSGTMLSRITGLLRDIAMAFAFGTKGSVAAFLMAFRFAHLLRRLLGEGALQSAFIPQFEKLRNESPERAGNFFIDLTGSLTALLFVVIALSMTVTGALAFGDFLNPDNKEIAYDTFLMLPSLLFICLFGINAALLQCHNSYFIPGISPVAFNLVWIGGVLLVYHLPVPTAMTSLALFVVLACFAQWLLTLPFTLRILHAGKVRRPSITFFSQDVRALASPLLLGIVGVAASQINNALDVIFARYADTEGPAFLWYAIRLQQLPLALFGIAFSSALLPPLTRSIKNNDRKQFAHLLDFSLCRTFAFMLPLSVGIFWMGEEAIKLIYGHGDFSLESVSGTTNCLWAYGIGLVPMALVLIVAPAFYAQENFRLPMRASVFSMALNIGLNALLVMGFSLGAASVAAATSVSAGANLGILLYGLHKAGITLWTPGFKETLKVTSIACVTGSLGAWGAQMLQLDSTGLQFVLKVIASGGSFIIVQIALTKYRLRKYSSV